MTASHKTRLSFEESLLDVEHHVALDEGVTNRGWHIRAYDLEGFGVVLYFLLNCVSPESGSSFLVYLQSLLNHLWKIDSLFLFASEGVFLYLADYSVSLFECALDRPRESGFFRDFVVGVMFCQLKKVWFFQVFKRMPWNSAITPLTAKLSAFCCHSRFLFTIGHSYEHIVFGDSWWVSFVVNNLGSVYCVKPSSSTWLEMCPAS